MSGRIRASAPGKLVVAGEYAVLEGAPALVLAVDRRVRVEMSPSAGSHWQVASPTLGLHASLWCGPQGWEWDAQPPEELRWVAGILHGFAPAADLPPQHIALDSAEFFARRHGRQEKLGLGSSAALVVALLGALHRRAGMADPDLETVVAAHRAIQNGAGSGVGVAAALMGGLLRFQLEAGHAQAEAFAWPAGVHWRCVDAGRPTSTRVMLAAVAAAGERDPRSHARVFAALRQTAERVMADLCDANAPHLLRDLERYAGDLEPLGRLGGVSIVSAEHAALAILGRQSGCVYKSCGAGGGDTGIALATNVRALDHFTEQAEAAGYRVLELPQAVQGLELAADD